MKLVLRTLVACICIFLSCGLDAEGGFLGGNSANVGTDWTDTTKTITTTGNVNAHDFTATGLITPSAAEGVKYNQGDTNAVNTTVEAKLDVQVRADTDYTSLALAISNIGSTVPTRLQICANNVIADGTTLTFTSNITPDFGCGGTIDGVAGGGTETLVLTRNILSPLRQIFKSNVVVTGLTDVYPEWFGAAVDGTTDDQAEWQRAFNSFPTTGGKFNVPDGVSLIETPIIWPHSATDCYPIWVEGKNGVQRIEAVGGLTSGPSQIHFTGTTGALFEAMGEAGTEELTFNSRLSNFNAFGTEAGGLAGTYGLHAYSLIHAQLENIGLKWFEKAIFVDYRMYYAKFDRVSCRYNTDGLYVDASGSACNGTNIFRCQFNSNERYGIYILYGGEDITVSSTWIEGNGSYGLYVSNPTHLNITNCYIESNCASSGNTQVYIAGTPFYDPAVTITGSHFYDAGTSKYSVYLTGVMTFNAIGNEFWSYNSTRAIEVASGSAVPTGCLFGNKSPKIDGYSLMQQSYLDRMFVSDQNFPGIFMAKREPSYMATMQKGDIYLNNTLNTTGVLNGGPVGWRVATPGAGVSVGVPTYTASTTATSATVDFSSNPTDLFKGMHIQIAGVTFGTSSDTYAKVISFTDPNTAILDKVCNQTVGAGAVTFNPVVTHPIFGAQPYRSIKTSEDVVTSGSDETTFATYTVPANYLGSSGGILVRIFGTRSASTGGKIGLYLGITKIEIAIANTSADWSMDAWIYNSGATNTQSIRWNCLDGTTAQTGHETAAIDTTAAMIVKVTGYTSSGSITKKGATMDAI